MSSGLPELIYDVHIHSTVAVIVKVHVTHFSNSPRKTQTATLEAYLTASDYFFNTLQPNAQTLPSVPHTDDD